MNSSQSTTYISLQQVLSEEFDSGKLGSSAVFGLIYPERTQERRVIVHAGAGNAENLFDLASTSKPLLALAAGKLHTNEFLNQPLAQYWAPALGTPAESISMKRLLSHRSGIPPHHKFYKTTLNGLPISWNSVLNYCAAHSDARVHQAIYSDLNYIFAGAILSQVHHKNLDQILAHTLPQNLMRRIGSAKEFTRWTSRQEFLKRCISTEPCQARGGSLHGVVHDHNCWSLAGRSWSGHAGLFSDIHALLDLAAHLLSGTKAKGPYSTFLPTFLSQLPQGTFRTGFDGTSRAGSQAGDSAGPHCFGHLGFTGTSIWVDPDLNAASVLLTNRVKSDWNPQFIRSSRRQLHGLGFALARSASAKR